VQYSADSGTTWSFLSATGTSQTYYNITIGGSLPLVPGTAYRFRVYAGYVPSTADSVYAPISGYSTATGSITAPTTVPGTPKLEGTPELGRLYEPFRTSVTVQNTGGAVVRFTGPTYSGGSAVTSYRVYDGAASTTSVLTIAASDAGQYERTAVGKYRTATVTWSAISAERYISVSAVNSAGESPKVTVRVPPIVDHVFQITSLTATPLAAGAMFSYPGGSTYAYSSAARAVTLAWSAPSATIAGMSANPQQPAFQIQVQSLASSTQATVSENWTDVMPLLSGRPYSQSGNTIDFLSPATPYVARVRAAYLNGVYGPFSYVTFTTVS
jgi:hypothetical protein